MSVFNPFSGTGKIANYIKWNQFRGLSWSKIKARALSKFGSRWKSLISSTIDRAILGSRAALAFNASGPTRDVASLKVPGNQRASTIRIQGRVKNSRFSMYSTPKGRNSRAFTIDLPKKTTKRQIQRSIREQILNAFFAQYDIQQKYKPDFRKRFGSLDIIDIEGL